MAMISPSRPLLSRVADAVYWMGRYIERAENVARFIAVNQNLMLDLPQGFGGQWQPIVDTTGDRAAFLERYETATQDNVVQFLAFDERNPRTSVCHKTGARKLTSTPSDPPVASKLAGSPVTTMTWLGSS